MPLSLPSSPAPREITWIAQSAVGRSESPFTLTRQTYDYGSSRLRAIVSIPPMTRSKANDWLAFFAKIRGGEFYLGDSSRADVTTSETPRVKTQASSGSTLSTELWTPSTSNLLAPGDWFDVVASNGKKCLFQCLEAVASDGSGEATISIFPNVRTTIAAATSLNFASPQGVFVIDDAPSLSFDSSKLLKGFSFDCSQVQ